jgi:soluble lytic murein transglycosylase
MMEQKRDGRLVRWWRKVGRVRTGDSLNSNRSSTGAWRDADAVAGAATIAIIAVAIGWALVTPPGAGIDRVLGRFTFAQLLPFERNKVEPIDTRKAFVEGYQAYQRRDYVAAIERMQYAARNMPELADYALYYLGESQRANGDKEGAAQTLSELVQNYPQSVLADTAGLEYARLELDFGHPGAAIVASSRISGRTTNSATEQNARILIAQAQYAAGNFRAAYDEAQALRERYPRGANDAVARALSSMVLQQHPGVANTESLRYRMTEAGLLLREGQLSLALTQTRLAIAMGPPPATYAELVWYEAAASRGSVEEGRAALARYLAVAPAGPHATAALNGLAHSYWRTNDTAQARVYFNRVVQRFGSGTAAPRAMFEIGRTYEDDDALDSARGAYIALTQRYPASESADDARFRAPFMLYMLKRYGSAAQEFAGARARSHDPSDRDMFGYWEGRALENSGDAAAGRSVLTLVATSIDSNYYPAIAAMRVGRGPESFPAAEAPEIVAVSTPATADSAAQFHLQRVLALREIGLRALEPAELSALEMHTGGNPTLRNFVLRELTDTGAWYDALQMAQRMVKRDELDPLMAERLRYPRGYWDLIAGVSGRNDLDPMLVSALIRQESLFNPNARSVSDARGLMQLLPSTAEHYASAAGVSLWPLDLFDPSVSVQIGTTYLRQLFAMFNGDAFKAVAAYNGGEHAVAGWAAKYPGDDDQFVENIGFHETRDYVKKVIGGLREYRLLYQHATAAAALPGDSNPQG